MKSLDIIIVLYTQPFRKFDRKRLEIDCLDKHLRVILHELNDALNPHFSEAYHGNEDLNGVFKFSSIFTWRKELLNIIKNCEGKVYVLNLTPKVTFKELLVNYILSLANVFLIEYRNIGTATYGDINIGLFFKIRTKFLFIVKRASFKWFLHVLKYRVTHVLNLVFCRNSDFILIVGNHDRNSASKFINANSFDYSMFLKQNREVNNKNSNEGNIVFIDSGAPLFKTDSFMLGNKMPITKELWYPALVNFFNIIEKITGNKVVIAAHPKHKYSEEDGQYFGSRQIVHDNTMEMISKASFVITLNSTAISYAVMCNKPVLFLLSNEILEDGNDLLNMVETYANILGSSTINIDKFDEELTINLSVNSEKYLLFKKNYLSSRLDKKTNGEIIIDIMSTRKNVLSKISHQ